VNGYYDTILAAERLRRVYQIAPPRVQQYLEAEIDHVLDQLKPGDMVLELGCGCGRVLAPVASRTCMVLGIDTSLRSLILGHRKLSRQGNISLLNMNAISLAFGNDTFDCVICIQNGISAFHIARRELVAEAVRVTSPGGRILFSSYSAKFWDHRLDWFRRQAVAGLLGEIDEEKTGGGRIVCRDGFTATTVDEDQFLSLSDPFDVEATVTEVDGSSLFCSMIPGEPE